MRYTYKHTLHACYTGYITQAIVNNLAPLLFVIFQDQFGISFEQVGRLILINFSTQIAADFVAVKFVDKIGYRKAAVAAHAFCALGLASFAILPLILPSSYMGLMIAVAIYAVGGGLIEVLISPIVDSLPGDQKESSMSLLHSFYCWGQMGVVVVTTLLLRVFGADLWMLLPAFWAIIPLYNLIRFLKVPLMPALPVEKMMSLGKLFRSKFFLVALVLMLCTGACELTMSQWSSLFAEKGLHVPKMLGDLLGPCLFAVFMGIGRMLYGIFGSRINLKNALLLCGVLCVGCYAVTVFAPNPVLSLFACALTGLSVSLMWPGTLSLTAGKFPLGGTAMFGMLALFGDVGGSIGPWIAGVVSDAVGQSGKLVDLAQKIGQDSTQLGLKCGLLVAIIFPIVLLIGVGLFKRDKKKETISP